MIICFVAEFGIAAHEGRGNNVQLVSEVYPNDARRLDVRCTRKGFSLKMYNAAGELEFER